MCDVRFILSLTVGGCAWSKFDWNTFDWPGKKFYKNHWPKLGTIAPLVPKTPEAAINQVVDSVTNNPHILKDSSTTGVINTVRKKVGIVMGLKMYNVTDSPPCLAVRMGLKYLGLECELVNVDYGNGECFSETYLMKNPQGEVPLLDDNGFLLSESVAILQYLADKYRIDDTFYPTDPQKRAVVNHRMAFHLSTYYKAIWDYYVLPCIYAYPQLEADGNKLRHAVNVFEEILTRHNRNYVAGDDLTIADLSLAMATSTLQVCGFDFTSYPRVKSMFEDFKKNHPDLWAVAAPGVEELVEFAKNPPNMAHLKHPVHPTDKSQMQ